MRPVALLLCALPLLSVASSDTPVRVLILSGQNNHDWKTTTPFMEQMFDESERFAADVMEDPSKLTAEFLAPYDVIVSNWSAYPAMTGRQWGPVAEQALIEFVRNGKGFVLVHAATACFSDWPEFQEMAGCTWGDASGHGKVHAFAVNIKDAEHPIAVGMSAFITQPDELYHRLTPQPSMHVVCEAYSDPEMKGTGQYEPVAVVTNYGKGRCFYNILGHNVAAMDGPGWRTLMLRGTEWAATDNVTIPIPQPWPSAKVNNPPATE
ncbi:MAG: hypothetical protein AMXMBFR84_14370 [Candidatus Hydrogenedentota bacterium]